MTTSTLDLHAEPREYNARIILDTATLRFDRGASDAPWLVASIMPTPGTGEACILGAVIQGGKIVDPHTGQEVKADLGFREVGSWVLVTALEGDVGRERGTYDWNEPFGSPFRVTRPDIYDVFSDMNRGRRKGDGGGIIVARYEATGEGRKPFSEVNVIPPAWHETVQSSFDSFRRDEPPFATATSRDEALSLLHAPNPLTALAAFRRLAEDVGANRDLLRQAILSSSGYLRAVFAYLALHSASDEATAFGVLETVIEEVDAMGGLPPLVAAIGTAGIFADVGSAMRDVANRLRGAARARLEQVYGGGEMDPYLKRVLYR
jgi:hypothetical protein